MGQIRYDRLLPVMLSMWLAACAVPAQTRDLLDNPPSISARRELSQTPFYPQREYQCGPAALATVLNRYGRVAEPDELVDRVYVPELKGSLRQEMIATAAAFGFLAVELEGRLSSLVQMLDQGYPVLVLQNLGLEQAPFWHYSVVIGYDLERAEVILRSGERQRLLRPMANFERTWQRGGGWAVVVSPADDIPPGITQEAFIRALQSLQQATSKDLSETLRLATLRWPRSYVLRMGLANAFYKKARYGEAEQAFREAIELSPRRAEAWNNLAYALAALQRKHEALQAVEQAIVLQPQNAEYQRSRTEILALP